MFPYLRIPFFMNFLISETAPGGTIYYSVLPDASYFSRFVNGRI
jgi:hypothetical protein